jgi:hypothetical protein
MTTQTAFAFDDRPPACGHTHFHGGGIERVHVSEVGDDAVAFAGREPEPVHAGTGNAVLDYQGERLICGRVAELAAPQIDAADAVAGGRVTGRTLRRVDARAEGDVSRSVLGRRCLTASSQPSGDPAERHRRHHVRTHRPDLYLMWTVLSSRLRSRDRTSFGVPSAVESRNSESRIPIARA